MASIFTYDPNPPRVSSPWIAPEDSPSSDAKDTNAPAVIQPRLGKLSEYSVTKLQAEPQEGPTEYKLHLLLRSRRQYTFMSTAVQARGPQQVRYRDSPLPKASASAPTSWSQTRQQRLQHLTTQLLWRLQQSSPYHASTSKELVIPKLPDDKVDLEAPIRPEALISGLEESRGALYEIGVSDDGTLVGLTKDEMSESITTLRIMAASLGCSVDVIRDIIVGECEWIESTDPNDKSATIPAQVTKQAKLWVAEAFVTPNFDSQRGDDGDSGKNGVGSEPPEAAALPSQGSSSTPQLRVTLTGPTTSGKSSLLGTLSTGTLDNGRGKSRLGLLKHRHEMVSGVTSSIAQELIGYRERDILNFSHGNIESWLDIHDCSDGGRLVFVSDSGGHPRYRRTVLRGLMNWAPHWSILCIAADDAEDPSGSYGAVSSTHDIPGAAATGVDLVRAHLTLSLKLEVPMAVVVTKLDLASKVGLQKTMVKILAAIKEAGRIPKILQPDQRQHDELQRIPQEDYVKARSAIEGIREARNLNAYVPIVLTSAVKGTGIGLLHALLESLPLPPRPSPSDYIGMALNPEQPKCLFHVDDTFSLQDSNTTWVPPSTQRGASHGVIVSGHVRFGNLSVGDNIVVGPFPSGDDDEGNLAQETRSSPASYGLSSSHPSSAELARVAIKNAVPASTIAGEWHAAQIVSTRNLRLPVRTLKGGQAGSIGLVFDSIESGASCTRKIHRIRRGMVLAIPSNHMVDTGLSLQAASGFTAAFDGANAISCTAGSFVNVYVASVRASARVLRVSQHYGQGAADAMEWSDGDCMFNLNDGLEGSSLESETPMETGCEVALELLHNREWVELGSRVILLEGGRQDRSGLEGLVGRIIEIVD